MMAFKWLFRRHSQVTKRASKHGSHPATTPYDLSPIRVLSKTSVHEQFVKKKKGGGVEPGCLLSNIYCAPFSVTLTFQASPSQMQNSIHICIYSDKSGDLCGCYL